MKKILFLLLLPLISFGQIETLPQNTSFGYRPASISSGDSSMTIGPLADMSFLGTNTSSTRNIGIGTGFSGSIFTSLSYFNDGKLTIKHNSTADNDTGENGPHLILDESSEDGFSRLRFRNTYSTSSGYPFTFYTYNRSPRYWDFAAFSNGASLSDDKLNFYNNGIGNIMTLRGDGKVGILTDNPSVALHINSNATSINSTTGAMILGTLADYHLTFDNNEINAYDNTSGTTLILNQESTGRVEVGGSSDLRVNGFTELGGSGAPNIKMKKLSGTTDADDETVKEHNLDKSKILSVTILINSNADITEGGLYPDHKNIPGTSEYRYYITSTDVLIKDVGTSLQNKPFKILITYEE